MPNGDPDYTLNAVGQIVPVSARALLERSERVEALQREFVADSNPPPPHAQELFDMINRMGGQFQEHTDMIHDLREENEVLRKTVDSLLVVLIARGLLEDNQGLKLKHLREGRHLDLRVDGTKIRFSTDPEPPQNLNLWDHIESDEA
jgi:hypothetical protein